VRNRRKIERERGFCVHKSSFGKPYNNNNHLKALNSLDLKGSLIGIRVFFSDVYFPFSDRDRTSIKKWKFENDRLNDDYCFFFLIFLFSRFLTSRRVCLKGCLVCDLEDFDVFDLEFPRTRENDKLVQFGVVGVRAAKGSVTVGVCAAVIGNSHSIKVWTPFGITRDCLVLLFRLQRKSPRRDVVRILQREKKTLLTVIRLYAVILVPPLPVPHWRFPLHRSEAAEDIPFRVQNHSQSVCVTVTSAVKVFRRKPIATSPPQKFKMLSPELCEDIRKL
jgi:hypothetical protein